jgi:hypothetical protein
LACHAVALSCSLYDSTLTTSPACQRDLTSSAATHVVEDDLRGQVVRGPTHGVGWAVHTLGKPKVSHLDVPQLCEEHVLRLHTGAKYDHVQFKTSQSCVVQPGVLVAFDTGQHMETSSKYGCCEGMLAVAGNTQCALPPADSQPLSLWHPP